MVDGEDGERSIHRDRDVERIKIVERYLGIEKRVSRVASLSLVDRRNGGDYKNKENGFYKQIRG